MRAAGKFFLLSALSLLLASLISACSLSKQSTEPRWLVLATTQDLNSSGLLDTILPPFEKANNVRFKRLPVSYDKALQYAADGGVDMLLVEQNTGKALADLAGPAPEMLPYQPEFNANPLAAPTPVPHPTPTPSFDFIMTGRTTVFWSDLVLVGPPSEGLANQYNTARAFKWVALGNLPFVVAGDAPGLKEVQERVWKLIGLEKESDRGTGYRVIAGDARSALKEAEATGAYTVVPRYVFLNSVQSDKLKIILGEDSAFYLGYEVSIPNTIRIPDRDVSLARSFVSYLTSNSTQSTVAGYKNNKSSDNLFRPASFRVYIP